MELTDDEVEIIRQWFNCLEDLAHPDYLQKDDYLLAKKLYEKLNIKVPNNMIKEIDNQ